MQLGVPTFEPPYDSIVRTLRVDGSVVIHPTVEDPVPASVLQGAEVVRFFHSNDSAWIAELNAVFAPQVEDPGSRSGEATPMLVQYSIEFSRRSDQDEQEPVGFESALSWFLRRVKAHAMGITGLFAIAEGGSQSRFPLPIPVPTPELAGFDALTAVEIVKWADDEQSHYQYSVVLQLVGSELQVVARTMVVWDWAEDLLMSVFDRTLSLAKSAAFLP